MSSFPPSFKSFPGFEELEKKESSDRSKEKDLSSKDRPKSSKRHVERTTKDFDSERKRRKKDNKSRPDDERKKYEQNFFEAGVPGLYIIDTAGDRMNEVYGKLHAGDIPRYKRTGCKLLLPDFCESFDSLKMVRCWDCHHI